MRDLVGNYHKVLFVTGVPFSTRRTSKLIVFYKHHLICFNTQLRITSQQRCLPQRHARLLPAPMPAHLPALAAPLQHPVIAAKSAKSLIGNPTRSTAPPLKRAIAISSVLPLPRRTPPLTPPTSPRTSNLSP